MQFDVHYPGLKNLVFQLKTTRRPFSQSKWSLGVLSILGLAALAFTTNGCGYSQPAVAAPTSNGVTVSPATATIAPGASQQFTATINGAATTQVTWSTNFGQISSSGVWNEGGNTTGTWNVTATSTANPSQSGTAVIIVSSSAPPPTGPTPTPTPRPPSATPTPTPTPTPSGAVNGWDNRIAGVNVPGGGGSILSFQNFDTFPATNTQEYFQMYDPSSITTDCTTASDGCSLKLAVLDGYQQGEPGWFDWNFSPDLSKTFGNGTEFYVQYRERWDSGMLNGNNFPNGQGIKHDIITEGDTASVQAGDCSNSPGEVVTIQDGNGAPYPSIYNNCGFSGGSLAFMQSPYQLIQLGGIADSNFLDQVTAGCPHYSGRSTSSSDPTCWNYVGDEWFTVQVHVKVGTFEQASSVIEFWMAHDGQPAELITNAADAAIVNDGSGGASGQYGKIQLSAYNTDMSGSLVNSAVWFDDLVASTRRIPDPNVATPNPPDSLSLSAIGASSVTVNWRVNSQNGTAQDDTGFLVERCTGDGTVCFPNPQSGFVQIATTPSGASSFVDSTVAAGTTYTYRVRATNASGNSGYAAAQCFNNSSATCGGTVAVP